MPSICSFQSFRFVPLQYDWYSPILPKRTKKNQGLLPVIFFSNRRTPCAFRPTSSRIGRTQLLHSPSPVGTPLPFPLSLFPSQMFFPNYQLKHQPFLSLHHLSYSFKYLSPNCFIPCCISYSN